MAAYGAHGAWSMDAVGPLHHREWADAVDMRTFVADYEEAVRVHVTQCAGRGCPAANNAPGIEAHARAVYELVAPLRHDELNMCVELCIPEHIRCL